MSSNRFFLHALTIAVIRYAQKQGLSNSEIGRTLGAEFSQQDLSNLHLLPEQLLNLIHTISQMIGRRFSGFNLIRFMKISDFGIAGYVLMNCRNMHQVQEKYQLYHQLMGNVTRLSVRNDEEETVFSWKPVLDLPVEIEQVVLEYLVASIVIHSFELTGKKLPVCEVEFTWPVPDALSDYTRCLGPNLHFNRSSTALHFDRSYLDLEVKTSNSELLSVFEDHAQERYQQLIGKASVSERVGQLLSSRIANIPKLTAVADELGMSARKLQFHLRDEGTTFLELRDGIRFQYARKALEADDSPAADIGLRLGFSEPSAFFRTFKRWSGKSPGQFREDLKTKTESSL